MRGILLLRIKTKDGTERLPCPQDATLRTVRELIEQQLQVPINQQVLHRSHGGLGTQKGAGFSTSDDASPLDVLGLANGDLLFLDYVMERQNQAQYVEKDPFITMAKDGELQ